MIFIHKYTRSAELKQGAKESNGNILCFFLFRIRIQFGIGTEVNRPNIARRWQNKKCFNANKKQQQQQMK